MSAHRWIGQDADAPTVSAQCFACGVVVDATAETVEDARALLPGCIPGYSERAHHYVFIGPVPAEIAAQYGDPIPGRVPGTDTQYLDCGYGDCVIRVGMAGEIGPCAGA